MNPEDAALVAALPGWAFDFMLVLARVSATVMLMPALGETNIPTRMRMALAFALTLLLLPILVPNLPAPPQDVAHDALLLFEELLIGIWLGWLARLLMLSLAMSGQIISYMMGLANVLQADGPNGGQVTALSHLFEYAAPVMIFGTGLYMLPLSALAGSYDVLPPGLLLPAGDFAQTIVTAVSQSFYVAFRVSAPFVLADITWHVSVGMLSRLAPSLHLFLVVMPGQILGGFVLLAVLAMTIIGNWDESVRAGLMQLPGLR